MWIGGDTPIELQRNARLDFSGSIYDAVANSYVDISGKGISCSVAMSAGGTVIYQPYCVIDDGPNGGFTVSLDGYELADVPGQMERVNLAYDVRIDGVVVMRGTLILLPGVGI